MEELEVDYEGKRCDYYNSFIKSAITELKRNGICYVYFESQVEDIKKKVPEVHITKNECGYTISINRKNRVKEEE